MLTAKHFINELQIAAEPKPAPQIPMGKIFALAKQYSDMPLTEMKELLMYPTHEARVGAVSIMDFQARSKKTSLDQRKALYDLYLSNHDKINNWDLVDRAAPYVIGGYLATQSNHDILIKLAHSNNMWERRTAIVSTYFFIRKGVVNDTFAVAEILANDPEDLVQKAVGGWIREAGKYDEDRLCEFLDRHAATMPRVALRYAIEHLLPDQRKHYLGLKKG